MAGMLEDDVSAEQPLASMAFNDHWEVQYARFVKFHSPRNRKMRKEGKWISTSSSKSTTASLKLIADYDSASPDRILMLSLGCKILEEHYVSRLNFAWPQVSCVSGFPARGARSVFVSYKDGVGQIQKFALRFSTICEIAKFISSLKEKATRPLALPCPPVNSAISSQSEFIPSDEALHRDIKEWSTTLAESGTYDLPASTTYGVSQESNSQEVRQNREAEEILSHFPPSFTSFLMNCGPAVEQEQPTTSADIELKAQIMKCLGDSSFQDVLIKVEKVINEVGDFNMLL